MDTVKTCLWFDTQAEEAARFYASVLDDVEIGDIMRNPDGSALVVEWTIKGQRFQGLNGGPLFPLSEAVSLVLHCSSQEEADRYWAALTADGGEESMCGWLKDRFGLSWQVIPASFMEVMSDPDPARAARAMEAMRTMRRLDVEALRAAANGEAPTT